MNGQYLLQVSPNTHMQLDGRSTGELLTDAKVKVHWVATLPAQLGGEVTVATAVYGSAPSPRLEDLQPAAFPRHMVLATVLFALRECVGWVGLFAPSVWTPHFLSFSPLTASLPVLPV